MVSALDSELSGPCSSPGRDFAGQDTLLFTLPSPPKGINGKQRTEPHRMLVGLASLPGK